MSDKQLSSRLIVFPVDALQDLWHALGTYWQQLDELAEKRFADVKVLSCPVNSDTAKVVQSGNDDSSLNRFP